MQDRVTLPDCRDPAERQAAVRRAGVESRSELVAALKAVNAPFDSPKRRANLAALAEDAACVVTGQQAGLFGGPLYTVHKTLSAIAVARAFEAESGRRVVPVFWLQSEDHDFDEIDHVGLPTTPAARLQMSADGGPDASVRDRHLTETEALHAAHRDALGTLPHADEVAAVFERHYRDGISVTQAFAAAMAELFNDIVIVDPRHPAVARLTAAIHRRALDRAVPIADALTGQCEQLRAAGEPVQVHVRPRAPLCFVHPDGASGPRFRLEPTETGWELVGDGRTLSRADLDALLATDPGQLSTSALLRPLLQDSLLPTVAYVGGPGEARYYAQLPPAYEAFGLPMPLFVPRCRLRIVDEHTLERLEQLGISADDLSRPWPEVLGLIGRSTDAPSPESLKARLLGDLPSRLSAFESEAAELDPGLAKAVKRVESTVDSNLDKLVGRYARALAQQNQATVNRAERLRELLAPDGAPQERVYGLSWFAARYGLRRLLDGLSSAIVPFDSTLKDVCVDPAPAGSSDG